MSDKKGEKRKHEDTSLSPETESKKPKTQTTLDIVEILRIYDFILTNATADPAPEVKAAIDRVVRESLFLFCIQKTPRVIFYASYIYTKNQEEEKIRVSLKQWFNKRFGKDSPFDVLFFGAVNFGRNESVTHQAALANRTPYTGKFTENFHLLCYISDFEDGHGQFFSDESHKSYGAASDRSVTFNLGTSALYDFQDAAVRGSVRKVINPTYQASNVWMYSLNKEMWQDFVVLTKEMLTTKSNEIIIIHSQLVLSVCLMKVLIDHGVSRELIHMVHGDKGTDVYDDAMYPISQPAQEAVSKIYTSELTGIIIGYAKGAAVYYEDLYK